MPQFTTQIVDASVISELPDVSILAGLYEDDITEAEIIAYMNSVSFRKKFQTLLEFHLSQSAKDSMYEELKNGYKDLEIAAGKEVSETDGIVYVDGRIVSFNVDGFADGLFEDASFATALTSNPVLNAIMGSGDESFIAAIASVPNFWNKIMDNATVFTQFYTDNTAALIELSKVNMTAYVKLACFLAEIDPTPNRTILDLIEDASAMDAIELNSAAKDLEDNSVFGTQARISYVFGNSDIGVLANSVDNIVRLENDEDLRSIIIDPEAIKVLPEGSLMRGFVIDNDEYFGALVSVKLGVSPAISMSNIFYDEAYAAEKIAFAADKELVALFFKSTLSDVFSTLFFDVFTEQNVVGQKFAFTYNPVGNTMIANYAGSDFEAHQLVLSLDGFTETKAASESVIPLANPIYSAPYVFAGTYEGAFIDVSHNLSFSESSLYSLYAEFDGESIDTVIGSKGHLIGLGSEGKIISSKFVVDLNLSTETILNIQVTENNAFIKTAETFHSIGNLGADKTDIINNLIVNKDTLTKAVMFNGQVLALDTSNSIQIVAAGGLSQFGAASTITAADIMVIDGKLIVLDASNDLVEIKADNSIVAIASGVTDLVYSQDAVVCKISGSERAIFEASGAWNIYDFNVNTIA